MIRWFTYGVAAVLGLAVGFQVLLTGCEYMGELRDGRGH